MLRILLVDDNDLNLDMLSRRLERKGYEVIPVSTGRTALVAVQELHPDLILLDMSLPDLNGWEVAQQLKRAQATSAIPILALTAYSTETDRRRALDAGCDDYDTKPVDFTRLLAKMAALSATSAQPKLSS